MILMGRIMNLVNLLQALFVCVCAHACACVHVRMCAHVFDVCIHVFNCVCVCVLCV